MFAFQDTQGRVEVAFTDRHRGTGGGPSASLDLATHGDRAARGGLENVRLVTAAFTRGHERPSPADGSAVRTVLMRQVHGAEVAVVDSASRHEHPPEADALVTALPGVVLLVRVADCVPVLLADADAGVVAAVHAGRPGLLAGVVPAAVREMRRSGASSIRGWLGPHVCGACYEVPEAMQAAVCAVVPEARSATSWGTPSVDIGAGVLAQLRSADVDVVDAARCTVEGDDLFSYRRQGASSGRLGGLVWIRP